MYGFLNVPTVKPIVENIVSDNETKSSTQKSHIEKLAAATDGMKSLYYSICDFIESLGDDIASNQLKLYLAYKKVQNMVCIEIYSKQIILFLKLNPETVVLESGFTRDMRGVGHYGTGDLQVVIKNASDFEKAKPLIERTYNES